MKSYEKMVEVNRIRSERMENTAIEVMRKKYESQEQVSIVALVEETGLSRGFFYKNERVRTELRRLQKLQAEMDFTVTRKVVLDKAIVLRIKELEAENRLLKMEIADLLDKNNKLEKVAQKKKEDYFNEL